VIRGDRGSALEGLTIRVGARWALEDDVAARHPVYMEPPILRPGYPEAQEVVVGVGATDQDVPPVRQRVGDQASLLMVQR